MKTVFDIDNWREIGISLKRNKTRSFLTGFGIFWGVLMLIVLWSGGNGLERAMSENFKGFSSNTVALWPSITTENYRGFTKGRKWSFDEQDVKSLKANVESIEIVDPQLYEDAQVTYKRNSKFVSVFSHCPDTYLLQTPNIINGRVINSVDIKNKSKVVVLGSKLAENLFSKEDPIGKIITINNVGYCVVGVIEPLSDGVSQSISEDGVHIPFSTMQSAFNIGDSFWMLMIGMKHGYRVADEKEKIQSCIFRNHTISPTDSNALQIFDLSEVFSSISLLLLSIRILAFIVGAGSLIAGVIGVGNIMIIIIKERTPEIGIRRAIGAKPIDIVRQILLESLVLTLLAGLSGLTLAVWIMALIGKASNNDFSITFNESMVILVLFIILGIAAGVLPARRALKIKPIEAMHDK